MRRHAVAIPDTPPPMMITRHGGLDERPMTSWGKDRENYDMVNELRQPFSVVEHMQTGEI